MEQTKALNALEPFLALSKSATSPAPPPTSSRAPPRPQTPSSSPSSSRRPSSPEYASHLALLQTFSHGTYQSYRAESSKLPPLNDAQSRKLRQLSLLTLARDRSNLTYDALQDALGLSSAPRARGPCCQGRAVEVTSIAPLRDLQPGAIPGLVAALSTWSDRCTTTLDDIDAQINAIRANAVARAKEKRATDDKMQRLLGEVEKKGDQHGRDGLPRRALNKRSMLETGNLEGDETMELDEPTGEEQKKRVSKRKI
ncbi:hypothetical protein ACCO45_007116 [Purpureocillium lilacinum]|uniref:Uncharacterized protein n=1 Tax=Purpureocillium lilacinum TaxID=33203 RepID=A0ACC4DRK3_PURLI